MIPERTGAYITGLDIFCQYVVGIVGPQATMAEIGVWTGAGTRIFTKYFRTVYAIDPWEPGPEIASEYNMIEVEAIFDRRFKDNEKIIKVRQESIEAAETFKDSFFDMVYIDAIHDYEHAKQDIEIWKNKIKKGGILAGHDYEKRFPGVKKAVDEIGLPFLKFPDTSWAVKL